MTIEDLKENYPFYLLFKYSLDPIAILDKEGNLAMVNQALCDWCGYTEKEFMKLHFANVTHQDYIMADLSEFTDLVNDKVDTYGFRKIWVHKQGHNLHGKLRAVAIKKKGQSGDDWKYVIGMVDPDQEVKTVMQKVEERESKEIWNALWNDPEFVKRRERIGKWIISALIGIILLLLGMKWQDIIELLR